MSPIRKSLYICILILTIFSLTFLGYTLYLVMETSLAARSLDISLLNVEIKEELSTASFSLRIFNPSNILLKLHYLRADISYANEEIGFREIGFSSSPNRELPSGTEKNVTINLDLGDQSFSTVGWVLSIRVLLDTSLPQRGGFSTVLET